MVSYPAALNADEIYSSQSPCSLTSPWLCNEARVSPVLCFAPRRLLAAGKSWPHLRATTTRSRED
eukprot:749726-Lingulodinium_polyedra.AAC.1